MSKTFKKITASIMAVTTLAISVGGMSANAVSNIVYPSSVNWSVHWSQYNSNSPQTKRIVSNGNGYYGILTSKAGSCSLNYVKISAPNMVTESISELNIPVHLHPELTGCNYIDFSISIVHSGGNVFVKPKVHKKGSKKCRADQHG